MADNGFAQCVLNAPCPQVDRVQALGRWLDLYGFEIVSGSFGPGDDYPALVIRPKSSPNAAPDWLIPPDCKCGHGLSAHGRDGHCIYAGCGCHEWQPDPGGVPHGLPEREV